MTPEPAIGPEPVGRSAQMKYRVSQRGAGLLRGACHRAHVCANHWVIQTTLVTSPSLDRVYFGSVCNLQHSSFPESGVVISREAEI